MWGARSGLVLALLLTGCGSDSEGSGSGGASSGGGGSAGSGGAAGSSAGSFDCLGSVKLQTTTETQAELFGTVLDGATNTPAGKDIKVEACTKGTSSCNPVASATTAEDGTFTLLLPLGPNGFDGWGEVSGGGYFTTLVYNSVPVIPDVTILHHFLVMDEKTLQLGAQIAGVTPDPAKGHVLVFVEGCDRKLAGGVSIELGAGASGTIAYAVGGGAISTKATETDSAGLAYVLNATPGSLAITARRASGGQLFGQTSIQVRAGAATELFFRPTP